LKLVWLFLLIISVLVFATSFWMLDFAIWYEGAYVYYPIPHLWGIRLSKGDIMNIAYWQIFTSFVLAIISAHKLGRDAIPN